MGDEYLLRVSGLTGALYIKYIIYGTESVRSTPLRQGSAIGNTPVRIIVGHDSGFVVVRSAALYTHIAVMPAAAMDKAMLAARLVTGMTDQNGDYRSEALAPEKYLALASDRPSTQHRNGSLG
jgi:hypothetical protein